MDTIGKLKHLTKIVVHSYQIESKKHILDEIASDPTFMVSGLRRQRDYTGAIRPYFMKCWGKTAVQHFFGLTPSEMEYILSANDRNLMLKRIDSIIKAYSTEIVMRERQFG